MDEMILVKNLFIHLVRRSCGLIEVISNYQMTHLPLDGWSGFESLHLIQLLLFSVGGQAREITPGAETGCLCVTHFSVSFFPSSPSPALLDPVSPLKHAGRPGQGTFRSILPYTRSRETERLPSALQRLSRTP